MKFLVVLVLAVFTGCHANLVWQNQPKNQVDMVKDAFWDYVAKATTTAEVSLKQIRHSELGKEVNTLISQSSDAINRFTNTLRTQVAPMTQEVMSKLTQETKQLRIRLEKDLATVGSHLQPYAEELVSDLQRQVEELTKEAAPYAGAMDPEALQAVVLQKSHQLNVQLDQSVNQLQAQMVPYAQEVQEKLEESLEEFQRSVIPMAQSFQAQLNQKTKEIQQNLGPYGEELKAKLDADTKNLKMQLTALWKSFAKMI